MSVDEGNLLVMGVEQYNLQVAVMAKKLSKNEL